MTEEKRAEGSDEGVSGRKATLLETIRERLAGLGIDLEAVGLPEGCCEAGIKVFGIGVGLEEAVRELSKSVRDQVVMVRVDEETARTLDAWVETGAVKSRSEAAALFIREGLQLRASELARLREALAEVESAKARLREKAREVFGTRASRATSGPAG